MKILLYRHVPCRSCDGIHPLYVMLEEYERDAVRNVRYQCPASGEVVGLKLTGAPECQPAVAKDWIECVPLFPPAGAGV
jgi:hypothetical protein